MATRTSRDPYAALGVPRDADADTIKKAYRRLAQQYHPDRNTEDPTAEERFKQVSAAYAVLSDAERRRAYDEFGEIALDPGFDAERARAASRGFGGADFARAFGGRAGFEATGGGFGGLFEDLFGGTRRQPRPRRGADFETRLELDFRDAILGCEQRVEVQRPGGGPETLTVRIPPGVDDGARIRLAGKGAPGQHGGAAGDLLARIRVRPHRFFRRNDRDLALELPISIAEAVRGATIEIPTLDGRVGLRVPPGSDGGTRLRLRGKGVPAHAGRPAGDLYVTLRIRLPRDLSGEEQERLAELVRDDPDDWRRELFS